MTFSINKVKQPCLLSALFLCLLLLTPLSANATQRGAYFPAKIIYDFGEISDRDNVDENQGELRYPLKIAFQIIRVPEGPMGWYRFGGPAGISKIDVIANGVPFHAPLKCLVGLSWPIQAISAADSLDSQIAVELKSTDLQNPDEDRDLVLHVDTKKREVTCSYKLIEDW